MSLPILLKSGIDTLIGERDLEPRLATGKPLKVKLGVDPTRPDLTFGHLVVFDKLRQFQDFGHEAILIIGDFTTLIGDPSGRSSTRPVLTSSQIQQHTETYLEQTFKILDEKNTTVCYNSTWFGKMRFDDALDLARKTTVARLLERDDFQKRYQANSPISLVEFLYPLLQGYDSLQVQADVELGGSDQLFNLLVGRALQKDAGQPEQAVMTLPLLIGLDGSQKMSKSLDNFIAFNDSPKAMYGKLMSISDTLMWDYYRLLLHQAEESITSLKAGHPMTAKKRLAFALTQRFHGQVAAQREQEQFDQIFSQRKLPDTMPTFSWPELKLGTTARLQDLLAATALFVSKKEARRLIEQGAVKVDGQKQSEPSAEYTAPQQAMVVQAGKRIFFTITPS